MRWKRIIGIVAAFLTVGYLVWLLAAAWFVRDGVRRINQAQASVTITIGTGVSWWPGRLSGSDLRVVVHESDVELDMKFDSFSLDVELGPLADRYFVTKMTRMDGVTFYFRQTRKLPELCAMPTVPPITGQASATAENCLAQKETALPPQGGGPEGIWHLDLNGIELTNVADVWLEDVRLRGHGVVHGRLYLWPGQELDLASESAHWDDFDVTLGPDKPLAKVANADFAVVMRDMEVPKHSIWEEFTSADATVTGALVQLARLGLGGVARSDVELHLRDGLVSGANVSAHADDFSVMVAEKKLGGSLDARVRVEKLKNSDTLAIRDLVGALREVKVDGKRYDGADMKVVALEGGRLDPRTFKSTVELVATGKSARPALALMPSTFGALVAGIAVGPDAPLTAAVKLEAGPKRVAVEPVTVEGGALSVAGNVTFLPVLKGSLTAKLGPITKAIEVP